MGADPGGGIIPARAGFTGGWFRGSFRAPDHPRSRGVYEITPKYKRIVGRIIPARAGFTLGFGFWARRGPDHPRSRGVYRVGGLGLVVGWGSSPLARGLRRHPPRPIRHRRIIPARAGFTSSPPSEPHAGPDHPRSRGVYGGGDESIHRESGSSPLARGLPFSLACLPHYRGIIPARAGFTSSCTTGPTGARDHPRSRGVYGLPIPRRVGDHGSSPLARGLPAALTDEADEVRIIPARAGFTLRLVQKA